MKTFLGLVLVSVLLRTGASLQCETCIGINKSCNGPQTTCEGGLDACATITSEVTIRGVTGFSVVKSCYAKSHCSSPPPSVDLSEGTTNTKIECTSGAAPPMASILPLAFSGLLLMKLLL
ncbi:hypothetical protein JRQ81_011614 [Phrynocephalus forsythii]|uniref:Phospholipase A2 inhibitor N-terminal domain-containing protein n=1 Tax=Phrynocephalus forsythii TaxID=171643 RepID=A0A9Q0X9E8_9SAUR|nr:hypothetical protein JRQ81_011614 [Phrynocephalus forsythii]